MTVNAEAPEKLPLLAMIADAYRTTWAHASSLGLVLAVWGTTVFVTLFAVNWLLWRAPDDLSFLGGFSGVVAPLVASVVIGASAAVVWHRLLLNGERIAASRVYRIDGNVLRYAGLVLALLVGTIVIGLLAALGPFVGLISVFPDWWSDDAATAAGAETLSSDFSASPLDIFAVLIGIHVLFAPLILVAVRLMLMLMLPAIAIGARDVTLRSVWQRTRGNSWRLYFGSAATIAPAHISAFIGNTSAEDRLLSSVSAATFELIWLVAGLVFVAFMSLAYRHFFPDALARGPQSADG